MSTEWTPERLNALPANTMLTEDEFTGLFARTSADGDYAWTEVGGGGVMSSADLAAEHARSLRVVSVPVDALLSEGTVIASSWFIRHPAARVFARSVLDASVGYVIGDPV